MNVKHKNTVSTMPNILVFSHKMY